MFHVCMPGENGFWFRTEASDDLANWVPLSTNVVTEGAIHFVDPDADSYPHRFYRAMPEADIGSDD